MRRGVFVHQTLHLKNKVKILTDDTICRTLLLDLSLLRGWKRPATDNKHSGGIFNMKLLRNRKVIASLIAVAAILALGAFWLSGKIGRASCRERK